MQVWGNGRIVHGTCCARPATVLWRCSRGTLLVGKCFLLEILGGIVKPVANYGLYCRCRRSFWSVYVWLVHQVRLVVPRPFEHFARRRLVASRYRAVSRPSVGGGVQGRSTLRTSCFFSKFERGERVRMGVNTAATDNAVIAAES